MTVLIDGQRIRMYPQHYQIFMALWNRRGGPVSQNVLITKLWPNPNTMPNWWYSALTSLIYQLNSRLRPTKFTISSRCNEGWYLVRRTN